MSVSQQISAPRRTGAMQVAFILTVVLASLRGIGLVGFLILALVVRAAGFAIVDVADWAVYLTLYVWCAVGMFQKNAAAYRRMFYVSLFIGISGAALTVWNYLQTAAYVGAHHVALRLIVPAAFVVLHLVHAAFSKRASDDVYLSIT